MGYNTYYQMAVEGADEAAVAAEMVKLPAFSGHAASRVPCPACGGKGHVAAEGAAPKINDGLLEEARKWYEWEQDLAAISRALPDATLTLRGEGEEQGDVWEATARNGEVKIRRARIVFDLMPEGEST